MPEQEEQKAAGDRDRPESSFIEPTPDVEEGDYGPTASQSIAEDEAKKPPTIEQCRKVIDEKWGRLTKEQ